MSLVWLANCGRTELDGADFLTTDGGSVSSGGLANLAGSEGALGGNPSVGGASNAGVAGAGTAGASAGEAAVVPDAGLYVDPVNGDDRQAGTRSDPLRTIARAASLARVGSTITLLDGVYDSLNQPQFVSLQLTACGVDSGVVIPSGVTLRADHSGQATLSIASFHGLCSSGGRIDGLRIERPTPGPHVIECGRGELEIHETAFSNIGFDVTTVPLNTYPGGPRRPPNPGLVNGLSVSGSAHVTLTPGALTGYSYGSNHRFAEVLGQATLTVIGGTLSVDGDLRIDPEDENDAAFRVADSATLTLHGVEVHQISYYRGTGISLSDSTQVLLDRATTVGSFGHGILGSTGAYRITLNDTEFTANREGVTLESTADDRARKGLAISGSRFARQGDGIFVYESNVELAILDSVFTNNWGAVPSTPGTALVLLETSGSVRLDHVSMTQNIAGVLVSNSRPATALEVSMRNSTVSSNSVSGITVSAQVSSVLMDLGSVSSPGNNVFQNNRQSRPDAEPSASCLTRDCGSLLIHGGSAFASQPILAVGNTWDAGVQGADARGLYTVIGSGARLEVVSGAGFNYRIDGENPGIVRLAENP